MEEFTKEQEALSRINREKAWRHFYPNGEGKAKQGYCLHHWNINLRLCDKDRYIQWRIEDLRMMTKSAHSKLHAMLAQFLGIGSSALKLGHTFKEESIEKMRLRRLGTPNTCANKTPEEMTDIKFRERVTTIERFIEGLKRGTFLKGVERPLYCITTNEFIKTNEVAKKRYNGCSKAHYAATINGYAGTLDDGTRLQWRFATPTETLQNVNEYL